MQTRFQSAIEAGANIVVGYTINFIANMLIFPSGRFQCKITWSLA